LKIIKNQIHRNSISCRFKSELDWDTINKLGVENRDFKEFVKRIKIDISSKEVRKEKYDKVYEIEKLKGSIKK